MTLYQKADPLFKVGDRVVVVSEFAEPDENMPGNPRCLTGRTATLMRIHSSPVFPYEVKLDDNSGIPAEDLTYNGWIAVQTVGPFKPSPFTRPGHTCWEGCHWEDVVR